LPKFGQNLSLPLPNKVKSASWRLIIQFPPLQKVLQSENETEPTTGVFSVYNSEGTSFLDGAVNIGQIGNNSFINCKPLIDPGALVPLGIAISEEFV